MSEVKHYRMLMHSPGGVNQLSCVTRRGRGKVKEDQPAHDELEMTASDPSGTKWQGVARVTIQYFSGP